MLESILIFALAFVTLFFLIRWIISSETEPREVHEKLKLYGGSELFERFYAKNTFRKAGNVIKSFEEKYPDEVDRLLHKRKHDDQYFTQNRDRYNYLIFKYQGELFALRSTQAKWFSKKDLEKHLSDNALHELLEGHVLNCYNNKYLMKDIYEAEHPFELDNNGKPLKIRI